MKIKQSDTILFLALSLTTFFGIIAFCVLAASAIVYFTWNLVFSPLFGWSEITFTQAILVGSFINLIGTSVKVSRE